jgi:hypothetical protein
VLVLLSVLQNVLPVNPLRAQTWQKLDSLSIVSVKVNVVNLTIHAGITDGEMHVVNVLAMFVLVFLLKHVFLIELSQGLIEVGKNFVEFTFDYQILTVVFLN